MFLLDTLDNLPRMRISNSLMNVFLWILHKGGAHNIPSLYHLCQVQASLWKSTGVPTTQHQSPKGNVYSMNDPRTLVAMVHDMTALMPAKINHSYFVLLKTGAILQYAIISIAIQWFPEMVWYLRSIMCRNSIRMWIDIHTLSPMYDAGNCHYYIDELACLKNGTFIIPVRWLEDEDGNAYADAWAVMSDHQVRKFTHVILINSRCWQHPSLLQM